MERAPTQNVNCISPSCNRASSEAALADFKLAALTDFETQALPVLVELAQPLM